MKPKPWQPGGDCWWVVMGCHGLSWVVMWCHGVSWGCLDYKNARRSSPLGWQPWLWCAVGIHERLVSLRGLEGACGRWSEWQRLAAGHSSTRSVVRILSTWTSRGLVCAYDPRTLGQHQGLQNQECIRKTLVSGKCLHDVTNRPNKVSSMICQPFRALAAKQRSHTATGHQPFRAMPFIAWILSNLGRSWQLTSNMDGVAQADSSISLWSKESPARYGRWAWNGQVKWVLL